MPRPPELRAKLSTKPDALNDPFDCQIKIKAALKRAESSAGGDRKKLLLSFLGNPRFFENWQSTFDNLGVCCFSRNNRDTLLWSHYADAHRGVCLKYEFRASDFLAGKIRDTTRGNVEYLSDPLTEWLKDAPMDMTKFVEGLAWKYEQESRIIRPEPGVFKLSEQFLNQVCFGLRTPPADIELIKTLARTYSGCTTFTQMVRDETEFGFSEKAL